MWSNVEVCSQMGAGHTHLEEWGGKDDGTCSYSGELGLGCISNRVYRLSCLAVAPRRMSSHTRTAARSRGEGSPRFL